MNALETSVRRKRKQSWGASPKRNTEPVQSYPCNGSDGVAGSDAKAFDAAVNARPRLGALGFLISPPTTSRSRSGCNCTCYCTNRAIRARLNLESDEMPLTITRTIPRD